jgi:hypothetical protein
MYPISSTIAGQEERQWTFITVSLCGSDNNVRSFGAAFTLNRVTKENGLDDSGPKPRGPTTPTAKMYDSHASKCVIFAVKLLVFCLGPVNNITRHSITFHDNESR